MNPRDNLLARSDLAYGFATMARGRQRKALERAGADYFRAAMAYDPIDADLEAMGDDELLTAITK